MDGGPDDETDRQQQERRRDVCAVRDLQRCVWLGEEEVEADGGDQRGGDPSGASGHHSTGNDGEREDEGNHLRCELTSDADEGHRHDQWKQHRQRQQELRVSTGHVNGVRPPDRRENSPYSVSYADRP